MLLLFIACEKESDLFGRENYRGIAENNASFLPGQEQQFKVTITSLSNSNGLSTPFAPGVWLTENRLNSPLFKPGKPDYGQGMEALAEDGDPSTLAGHLSHHARINSYGVFNTPVGMGSPAPIFPGESYEFMVSGDIRDNLHFATMFVQSNDLFASPGAKGIPLFDRHRRPIHGDITHYLELWDAGTEVNEEPGNGIYQAPSQSGPNMGPDENGVVQVVNDGFTYPVLSDVLRVTIEPL